MCGIAGIIRKDNVSVLAQQVKKMTDAINHRGPDGEGFMIDESNGIALGHRRLAIIDLSTDANQPMFSSDGRYAIMLNGEVYNYLELREQLEKKGYRFRTKSDTEVLLTLYIDQKEGCLGEVDGMFAFVIWDKVEQQLFCARDRFGEKPFYFFHEEGKAFYFASEMKALWAVGVEKTVNEKMLFNYLVNGHLQNPLDLTETFYNGIRKLEAAHYMVVDANCRIIKNKKYWELKTDLGGSRELNQTISTLKDTFYTSVKRRLRSDVPVGSSLSGGIDSSIVVMVIDEIKRGTQQVQKTFSARFPGYLMDEGRYIQQVVERCLVEAHYTFPTEDSILKNIDKVFYHQEEPFGSSSISAQFEVMELARKNNVTVMLDGQGADEIFAGYHAYYPVLFRELKKSDPRRYRQERQAYMQLHADNEVNPVSKKDLRSKVKEYVGNKVGFARSLKQRYIQFTKPEFNPSFFSEFISQTYKPVPSSDTLNDELMRNTTYLGLEQLLRYADRNSMAHSLEVRLPFLNHTLVELLFSLSSDYKIREGWTKWLLRKAFEDLLPSEIAWRRDKIGYEPPQNEWLQKKVVKELILEKRKRLVRNGILHKTVLEKDSQHGKINGENDSSWSHWMASNLYE